MFHFVKLRHNVTVFTRDDPFHMGDVMHPYFWKGFRCVRASVEVGVTALWLAGLSEPLSVCHECTSLQQAHLADALPLTMPDPAGPFACVRQEV